MQWNIYYFSIFDICLNKNYVVFQYLGLKNEISLMFNNIYN